MSRKKYIFALICQFSFEEKKINISWELIFFINKYDLITPLLLVTYSNEYWKIRVICPWWCS